MIAKLFRSAVLLAALFSASSAQAAGPLRILHLGKESTPSSRHAHVLMRELGRDAIWFDYINDPKIATADWANRFDAVLLDAPKEDFPALANSKKVFTLDFGEGQASWANTNFLQSVRAKIFEVAGEARRADWQKFLDQREPEKREPSPTVANYERRPEAITFQHPFSVQGSKDRTQVPIDMRLELFAGEPDIAKPIAFAWDDRGRCWVAETRDYPHGVKPDGQGNDSIKICEDTDGDGRADKFTVFAEKLNIPTSLVFARGGIIVSQPPRMLYLADTNGDDKADVREEIMTGWGVGDTHAQANNLHYGYDNWLYGCVGYSGFNGTVGGKQIRFAQGTFRMKADGSALEFLHQFSNNSWGQSANDAGDQFGGTANGAPIFYGGIPASVTPTGTRTTTARKINVEDLCHTITPNFRQVDQFGRFTAAAGSAFIYSANMPDRVQGMAMVCEPTMKNITLMDVQPNGAGYTAKDGFNILASSDEWMSPVFAEVGPDGAVWVADWQNFIIQHNPTPSPRSGGYQSATGPGGAHENPLRDHERGRIYRIVWEKHHKPIITSLRNADPANLVVALSNSDNQFWRLTAQRLLVEGKKTNVASVLKALVTRTNTPPIPALHALWTLHGLGQLDEQTHLAALRATGAKLRRNATRALTADDRGQRLFFSVGVISDPDPITKLAAMVKLAEFPAAKEIKTVVASLSRNSANQSDNWLAEATRMLSKKHNIDSEREGPNLLPNPSLEIVGADGLPEGWKRRDYGGPASASAEWKIITGDGNTHSGKNAVACTSTGNADTSLFADVPLKPNTHYRLAGWVKSSRNMRGKLSFNDHIGRAETDPVRGGGEWTYTQTDFNSENRSTASINILFVAGGEGSFDDVKLCELTPEPESTTQVVGLASRGEEIFHKHVAACVLCHSLKGQGSTVGPALDGIATRGTPEYIRESLLEPSKVIAKGYEALGKVSPMPIMADIFSPQELEDIQAYLKTLK